MTFEGVKVTRPSGLAATVITTPPAGAGALSVTVPVMLCEIETPGADVVRVMAAVPTLTVVVPGRYPSAVARMFVVPGAWGTTDTVAVVPFAGIVTLEGIEITLGSNPDRFTVSPMGPAAGLTVMVRVPGEFVKFSGLGVRVIPVVAAVMVTV